MLILVAMDPRLYGEALGDALQDCKPYSSVRIVEPDALVSEVARLAPDMVLCDRRRPDRGVERLAWIEYSPYAGTQAMLRVGDHGSELDVAGLADLLSVVDEAENLL